MKQRRVIFIALLIVGVGIVVSVIELSAGTHTVTRTERGFEPSRLLVNKGDSVTFVTELNNQFWPASDSHPTHGKYSEFDPKRALEPGESWSFTFDRAGVWAFHDHLASAYVGKILVKGEDGESTEVCLTLESDGTIQPECWETELIAVLETDGIAAAFDSVASWYSQSPDFQRNCHDVMHILGDAAYSEFLRDNTTIDRPETSFCGWGFYHGFMETMLLENGPEQYTDVHVYCSEVGKHNPPAKGPCFHGIGHAAFDSIPGDLWGDDVAMTEEGVRVCESVLSDTWERIRCASGVYNALANAYSARDYNLSYNAYSTIPPVCREQKEDYQAFCNMETGNGFIRDQGWSSEAEISFITSIGNPIVRETILTGYMDTEVRRHVDSRSPESFAQECQQLDMVSDVKSCIEGVLIGLRGIGEPGNERESEGQFCSALEENYQAICSITELPTSVLP